MKRKTLTLFLLLATLAGVAAPVGRQQARGLAQAFMAQRGIQIKSEPLRAPGRKASTDTAEPLYVFNSEEGRGFVIIAGDDRAEPVLGYTEQGVYDERTLPDNFRSWLLQTAEEIASLPKTESLQAPKYVPTHQPVGPLLETHWNQGVADKEYPDGYIYNMMTPVVDGVHCVTGCVATVGAQIMYYFQHPKGPTQPVPAYRWAASEQPLADLPPTTFRWDEMKPIYTSADQNTPAAMAVSELMLYCGYASEMYYGTDGSGSSNYTLVQNMVKYFDYDPYTWRSVSREAYSVSEWDSLIYHELAERRPVAFSGIAWAGGGHAFICDGYDGGGLYHFNWGWGGGYNGWFKLHATNPYYHSPKYSDSTFQSGFIMNVSAVIGIQPTTGVIPEEGAATDTWETPANDANDTWEVPTPDGVVATVFRTPTVNGTSVSMMMGNANDSPYGFGYGVAELLEDGTLSVVDDSKAGLASTVLSRGQAFNLTFDFASYNLSAGSHLLVPVSKLASESTWRRCLPLDLAFHADVDARGRMTVEKSPVVKLEVENFRCYTSRLRGQVQRVAFDITNLGDNFDGRVYLFASKTDEKVYVNLLDLKMLANATHQHTIYWPLEDDAELGTYNLWLATDYAGKEVLAQASAELVEGLRITDFACVSSRQLGVKQTFRAHLVNPGGNSNSTLYLFASTYPYNRSNYVSKQNVSIREGGEKDFTITYTPSVAGTYRFWLCSDADGKNVASQTDVEISQTVEATDITCPGLNLVGGLQPVTATVASRAGDFNQPLYLFASRWENMKGSAVYCAPAAIEVGKTEPVLFYFKPTQATDYYLWICTDEGGQHVIGQSKVAVLPVPDRTTLEGSELSVTLNGTTALASVHVKNTGGNTYYGILEAWLYLWDEEFSDDGNRYARYVKDSATPEFVLPAGEERTFDVSIDDLLPGRSYRVRWNYYPYYGTNSYTSVTNAVIDFNVPEHPAEAAQLACVEATSDVKTSEADAVITIENTGNVVYTDALRAELSCLEGESYVFLAASEVTPEATLQPGRRCTLSAHFAGLEAGRVYLVLWFYRPLSGGEWTPLTDSFTTSIASVSSVPSASFDVYTLSGTRLAGKPLQPGVYVRGGRKVLVK